MKRFELKHGSYTGDLIFPTPSAIDALLSWMFLREE